MMVKARRTMAAHRTPRSTARHRHSKAECIKILRNLSPYLDDELAAEVCREIHAHLGACPNCEVFLDSLRQTIALCRHAEPAPLSPPLKARLRRQILNAIGRAKPAR
ncbi:MAG: anti-sigma factor family protein [Nitrospiraceae bacterium]